jgi:uncharacterized protein with ParB-like and HNH nuclease domain
MKASETLLKPLLEGTNQYIIPLFQRPYSWRDKDWNILWDDLMELYNDPSRRRHFLGAVVTMPVDMQPHGVSKYLLIDGQQRLTTAFILLATIRDLAVNRDDHLDEQITDLYLTNKYQKDINRLKLLPTQGDRAAFQSIIQGKEHVADGSITACYKHFRRLLINNSIDLARLSTILVTGIEVVSIVLDTTENPYVIFESLNAKGEPLTQADLVRNYLFMRIPDEQEQEVAYDDYWLPMQKSLERSLTDYIWRYLSKDGATVRQTSVYQTFKDRLQRLTTPKQVIDVLMEIHTYAEYYRRIIDPVQEPEPALQRRFDRLIKWEVATAHPFLLALYHDYACKRISLNDFCRVIDAIESFVVRRFFCGIPTNTLNSLFVAMYPSVDVDDIIDTTHSFLLARSWPNDEQFLAAWISFNLYTRGTQRCRFILNSLEEKLTSNNEPVDLTNSEISIEHIMPQTLSPDWKFNLGSAAESTHATWLHTVGNLTLSGKNGPLGNDPFLEKLNIFISSNFALNAKLAGFASWDADAIQSRARSLGQIALTIWNRPSDVEAQILATRPTGRKPVSLTLFGQAIAVKTWREVLERVLANLAERHGPSFAPVAVQIVGTRRQYVAYTADNMHRPAPLPNTTLFYETNVSAATVTSIIEQMTLAFGHPTDSVIIETVK